MIVRFYVVEYSAVSSLDIYSGCVSCVIFVCHIDVGRIFRDGGDRLSALFYGDCAVGNSHVFCLIILIVGGKRAFYNAIQIAWIAGNIKLAHTRCFLTAEVDYMIGQLLGIFRQLHTIEVVVEVFVHISIPVTSHYAIIGSIICVTGFGIRISSKSKESETLLVCRAYAIDASCQLDNILICSLKECK